LAQVLFYHLTRSPVALTAGVLLGKALAAGWRVALRGTDRDGLERLDARLWLGPDAGFLPHGLEGGPFDGDQPILLGLGAITNGAQGLMLVDGAAVEAAEAGALERVWVLFDGSDEGAVSAARAQWKVLTGAGVAAQYWSEADGHWEKKADSTPTPA